MRKVNITKPNAVIIDYLKINKLRQLKLKTHNLENPWKQQKLVVHYHKSKMN